MKNKKRKKDWRTDYPIIFSFSFLGSLGVKGGINAKQAGGSTTHMADRVGLGEVTDKNVGQLRLLNQVIFPVQYHDKFYNDLFNQSSDFTRLGFFLLI